VGTIERHINNSKGCGGVMRTAPAGLAYAPGQAFEEGAAYAAVTHGHPSGYLTGGFIAEMVACLREGRDLSQSIDAATALLTTYEGHMETLAKVQQAVSLASASTPVEQAIADIGEGWIGEEALAVAIYAALKFPHDWSQAVLAAANHAGDCDSTASICGAILGTALGVEAIPTKWVSAVENSARIRQLADDMYALFVLEEELALSPYPAYSAFAP
jgi:ADP-ribosylglycohydrolase